MNSFIDNAFLHVARKQKTWALEKKNDKKWRDGACVMSLEMRREYEEWAVEKIALQHRQYIEHRQALRYGYKGGSISDPVFYEIWQALLLNDSSLLYKHFRV